MKSRRRIVALVAVLCGLALAAQSAQATVGPVGFDPPTGVAFGAHAAGTTTAQTVTLTNEGDEDLVFGAGGVSLAGTNPGQFAIANDTCSGATVAAGLTCTFDVRFSPTTHVDATAAVSFSANVAIADYPLSGTGTQAVIGVAPTSIAFPATDVGATSTAQTITVTNSGTRGRDHRHRHAARRAVQHHRRHLHGHRAPRGWRHVHRQGRLHAHRGRRCAGPPALDPVLRRRLDRLAEDGESLRHRHARRHHHGRADLAGVRPGADHDHQRRPDRHRHQLRHRRRRDGRRHRARRLAVPAHQRLRRRHAGDQRRRGQVHDHRRVRPDRDRRRPGHAHDQIHRCRHNADHRRPDGHRDAGRDRRRARNDRVPRHRPGDDQRRADDHRHQQRHRRRHHRHGQPAGRRVRHHRRHLHGESCSTRAAPARSRSPSLPPWSAPRRAATSASPTRAAARPAPRSWSRSAATARRAAR